ncbi:MAG: thymidine kinase [Candidatus Bipolaricaulota bacterium]|nr:thymidine kinase [Candidatus Bipolaricaulota bacterium]MDW8126641.1 thymidine kinase [Candidatus Bipolaricaulota bacterium]
MVGRLEVITGPMFAGKTEELLRRVERARIARKSVALFKPELDDRYAKDRVVAHNGKSLPCHLLPPSLNFHSFARLVPSDVLVATEVFAFDEAHFFGPEFPDLCETLVRRGKRVIVAGLDLNFRGEPFGPMPVLLALADEALKLTAVCTVCGNPATRSQRLVDGKPTTEGPEVLIGGLETYEPRCREHFLAP